MAPLPPRQLLDTRMAKALSHPVRVQVLTVLHDREASPSEIAREIDVPIVNVSHHVGVLRKLGIIRQVAVRHVRGAVEHRYRLIRQHWLEAADIELLPPEAGRSMAAQVAGTAVADLRAAISADNPRPLRPDSHISFNALELDAEGWKTVYDRLLDVMHAAIAEEEASRARIAAGESTGPAVRGRLSMFLYEARDPQAA